MMEEKTTNFVPQACACFFLLRCAVFIAWNGWRCFAGSAVQRACSDFIRVHGAEMLLGHGAETQIQRRN